MPWPIYQPDPIDTLLEEIIEDLRALARTDKRPYYILAADAKLASSTIQKLASGETKRPQLRTIMRLALTLPNGRRAIINRLESTTQLRAAS